MAEKKLNPSITTSGPITFFIPTADVVVDDEGNTVNPGEDALEVQRQRMQAEEERVQREEEEGTPTRDERRDLLQAASQKAATDKTSTSEALEKLEKTNEADKKLVEEETGVSEEDAKKRSEKVAEQSPKQPVKANVAPKKQSENKEVAEGGK